MLSINTKVTYRLIKFLSILYIATTKYQNVNALIVSSLQGQKPIIGYRL